MGLYGILRKLGKGLLHAGPQIITNVNITQIDYDNQLQGKTIIVTGGSKGIGRAMTKKFTDSGASVLIVGRDVDALEKASKELCCEYLAFDVSTIEDDNDFISKCAEKLGKNPDCLVLNAGISLHEQSILSVTDEGFDKQFNTNLKGAYFLAKSFISLNLKESTTVDAEILFISSETGDMAYDIPYGLSKASINSLVRGLSKRFYKNGIRVNAIAPGLTATNMTKVNQENLTQHSQASGRMFLPEEIAEVACFLLSDATKCISGEIIHCNAGNHIKTNWEQQ